jgi:predicted phage baseplate assembly protein
MLAGAEQRLGVVPGRSARLRGDTPRTWLNLASGLAYSYVRDSVRIYANVIDSTHGETRREVLGSGNAATPLQRFQLKAKPLTYVSAPTPEGAASTLGVRVDEVLWHEAPGLATMGPRDRKYLTETSDDGTTAVVFGDGRRGERLPTGIENVAALYRTGIGKGGNLDSDRISQLASKPLGLKGVTNPLPATGGADPDSRDAARRNAPLAVTALDRLVSLQDYEDFTRLYAGIGKASAVELSDGRRRLVHVTIAGADDIPIAPTSDLFVNLGLSLRAFGDPHLPVLVAVRELLLLVISAKVRVQPDYLWELVEPKVRAALTQAFGFDSRELGQSVAASEVVSTVQSVPGVEFVDLDVLDSIGLPGGRRRDPGDTPERLKLPQRVRAELARVEVVDSASLAAIAAGPGFPRPRPEPGGRRLRRILPAQLAILKADVPETLLLSELPR